MRFSRAHRFDVLVAPAVAGLVLVGMTIAPPGRIGLDPLGYALPLGGALALLWRRRAPATVLVVTTGCVFVYLARGYPGVLAALPVLVALFSAVRAGHRWLVLLPKAALVVVVVLDITVVNDQPIRAVIENRFLLAGWMVASVMTGSAFSGWSKYVREVEERAAEAERSREETALRRADEERLRIARELHDSLTHSISIIKVQAGVAVHLARKHGETVPEALLAVQEASGEAMRELRATLEVLRHDGVGSGLDRLDDLVVRAQAAGLRATVTIDGTVRALPPDVDLTAYRIVQEALTNVARHAGPAAAAAVRITYRPTALIVQISDDGLATPEVIPKPGVGLTGMRERVAALGGRLDAEPRPTGGFGVRAELPVRALVEAS